MVTYTLALWTMIHKECSSRRTGLDEEELLPHRFSSLTLLYTWNTSFPRAKASLLSSCVRFGAKRTIRGLLLPRLAKHNEQKEHSAVNHPTHL